MPPSAIDTLCGYAIVDVRKSLVEAIDRRDRRAAHRWAAELVATPAAVGSLWAAFWVAWASGSSEPTVPLLLKQSWAVIFTSAHTHLAAADSGWRGFRNDTDVRSRVAEVTVRLLDQGRQTPVVWPTKEISLHDVGVIRRKPSTATADGPVVMSVWIREDDAFELRQLAGHWLDAIEGGDIRTALSIMSWSLLPFTAQGIPFPLKCGVRGHYSLPVKVRSSPIWFWLKIGHASFVLRTGAGSTSLHPGWATLHTAMYDAFELHWKRWTANDRMRVLLAWTLQLRASFSPALRDWSLRPIHMTSESIDMPYREIATELANPQHAIHRTKVAGADAIATEKETRLANHRRIEEKMAAADAAVMSVMGLDV